MRIREYVHEHYRHFNAATVCSASAAYVQHLESGGKMLLTMAGAMSTAELGRSLAEMIRRDKVHAICCTGANLEEDLFNLVAHENYRLIPHWRNLHLSDEKELEKQGLNRVTDTCIPEDTAIRALEGPVLELWKRAETAGERYFPHEFLYQLLLERRLADHYQADPQNSWMLAAAERNLPIFVPGWEDSTLGNIFVSHVLSGDLKDTHVIRGGLEYMAELANFYAQLTMGRTVGELQKVVREGESGPRVVAADGAKCTLGFFQIGGGIAGDFPICVVPMIHQDLERSVPYWGYFCQISDSTTSYGSYSGATPSEKITWGKMDISTPMFVIESDATIVAPLMFGYILDW